MNAAVSKERFDERAGAVLRRLGLSVDDRGTVSRPRARQATSGAELVSFNPASGGALGRVATTSSSEFDALLDAAVRAALAWRETPAPLRGQAVRRYAELLRKHTDALGTLVSLETGKIKAEGDGEVQEMIDIADFAVGQSRMLYGKSLHSERPAHRMY
jgi:aldehyde dehydrogenase (NAD+)